MRKIEGRRIRRPLCLISAVFIAIVYITSSNQLLSPSSDVKSLDGRTVTVEGTVADRQHKDDISYIYLKNVSFITDENTSAADNVASCVKSTGIKVNISDKDDVCSFVRTGAKVRARGVLALFESPTCEGQFDLRTYYMIRGYEAQLKRARLTGASESYSFIREKLRYLRDMSVRTLNANMSEEDAGLVAAMTLGDRNGLDEEIKELYQNAGISHVLALSGLHIASVGLALLALFKKTGMGVRPAAVAAGSIIAVYAVMTGMSTSTVRALIMFLLSVAAILLGRTYDLRSAAAFSAVVILAYNNRYIYDTGFLLSFLAVMAIAYVYPLFEAFPDILLPDKKMPKAIRGAYNGMSVSLSVTLVTLPVTAYGFMKISLCSVVINLVVIPLMGVVLCTGFAGIFLGDIGVKSGFILKITHYILLLYRFLAEKSEKIPGNTFLTGRPSKWQIITYAVLFITAVIASNTAVFEKLNTQNPAKIINRTGRRILRNNDRSRIIVHEKIAYVIENRRSVAEKRAKKLWAYGLFAVMIVGAVAVLVYQKRETLEIRNVDVGQGDCSLIWGENVSTVMIDGGSSDVKRVAKYRIEPVLLANRIRAVDYCILTHMDSDHVSGVIEMLEDERCPVRIRKVIISDVSYKYETSENLDRLLTAARKKNVKVETISADDTINPKGARIRCIAPKKGLNSSFDANALSLVMHLTCKDGNEEFSALFTGDIGDETEHMITNELCKVSYLKVAHHGSATSSSDDFLVRTKPAVSVISVGEGNSYGHPAPATLERLARTGTCIYRTDRDGEVITLFSDKGIRVIENQTEQ